MKISKSKGKLKVGDWVRTNGGGVDKMETWLEGEIGEIEKDCFYIWQNEIDGGRGDLKPTSKGYKYSWFIDFNSPNEIEVIKKNSVANVVVKYTLTKMVGGSYSSSATTSWQDTINSTARYFIPDQPTKIGTDTIDSLFTIDYNGASYSFTKGDKAEVGFSHFRAVSSTYDGKLKVSLGETPKANAIQILGTAAVYTDTLIGIFADTVYSDVAVTGLVNKYAVMLDAIDPGGYGIVVGYQSKYNTMGEWLGVNNQKVQLVDTLYANNSPKVTIVDTPAADSIRFVFFPLSADNSVRVEEAYAVPVE